ncbi:MAG: hypothetical protein RL217_2002, partial [Pseudomonadota bacterium]
KNNLKGMWFLWGFKGLFPKLLPQYLDFFRPSFHPNDHDTVQLLDDWRQKMLSAGGVLYEQMENAKAARATRTAKA